MEAAASFYGWMHADMGYTFDGIPRLTNAELNTLTLAWMVRQEQEADRSKAARDGTTTHTAAQQRRHKDSIRRRLMED